jgi:hypothetical protein
MLFRIFSYRTQGLTVGISHGAVWRAAGYPLCFSILLLILSRWRRDKLIHLLDAMVRQSILLQMKANMNTNHEVFIIGGL